MIISNIKSLMEERGVTVRELEEKTGISNRTIMRARCGDIAKCRLYTLQAIADYLSCNIKDLFEEQKEKWRATG